MFFCEGACDHRDLHVLTHSFPTLRSSDLPCARDQWGSKCLRANRCGSCAITQSGSMRALTSPHTRWVSSNTADSRSEEHTSELQSLMRISYAVFCLKKKKRKKK